MPTRRAQYLASFTALLAALCISLLVFTRPLLRGDFPEYALTAIAIGHHGTPDVRTSDIDLAVAALPEGPYKPLLVQMRRGMAAGEAYPLPGFVRAKSGRYFAIHFFAYSALAALPLRLIGACGGDLFIGFQIVNYLAGVILGLSLFAFFRSGVRASAALALFAACGGILYGNWSSPEMVTACGLLASLLLCAVQRPMAAAVLSGVAAMQNPPLVFVSLFIPLFSMLQTGPDGSAGPVFPGWRALALDRRILAAALQFALAGLPALFFLWQFGVPSLIAQLSTDFHLVSLERLVSYYFDLSQGMVVSVPAVPLLVLYGLVHARTRRTVWLALLTVLLMLVLAVPSLSAQNWNSGAQGVMRYAFWGAMPLLFLAFHTLRALPRWPWALVGIVLAVQAGAMLHDFRYPYTDFSPAARFALDHAPTWYNPEPEIFFERRSHGDGNMDIRRVQTWPEHGVPTKVLFHANNSSVNRLLCGPGRAIPDDAPVVEMPSGWRYLNHKVACVARPEPVTIDVAGFADPGRIQRIEGWSKLEFGGANWDGMWTDGPRARLRILTGGKTHTQLFVSGHYFWSVSATQVLVNGHDLGRMDLTVPRAIPLPRVGPGEQGYELEFRQTVSAPPPGPETRRLGFFLQELKLR
jgi:hypothetical protein